MTKAKTKKESYSGDEVKRYLSALSENFTDKVKVIGEQYSSIQDTLNAHGKILQKHSQMLEEHNHKLDSHTQMIGQIMIDVTEIKGELKQKVDYADFAKLELKLNR